MRWPRQRLETRADSSYTDALVQVILSQNSGTRTVATATATAAVEAAAGIIGRAFAAADVAAPAPVADALTPACLNLIGRTLIRKGAYAAYLDVVEGLLTVTPAADWDVSGGYDPTDWRYRLNLPGPTRTTTRANVRAESVLHVMYAADPETPWRGVGPVQSARIAGRLSAETAQALADEAGGPRGSLLGVPAKDGADSTLDTLKGEIRGLKGSVGLIEDKSTWRNDAGTYGGRSDWKPDRVGAHPPDSLIKQMSTATVEILAACGVPPELVSGGDGTSLRESYRRLLHSTIAPLGRMVQAELRAKIHAGISLSFDSLFAADLSGRARAFQSMVGGGMDVAKAAALAGLMQTDD